MSEHNWNIVERTLADLKEQSNKQDKAANYIGLALESPILEPFLRAEELLIEALEALVGDKNETIAWYVYECDYGDNPMEAGLSDDVRSIDTVERLRWLIEVWKL